MVSRVLTADRAARRSGAAAGRAAARPGRAAGGVLVAGPARRRGLRRGLGRYREPPSARYAIGRIGPSSSGFLVLASITGQGWPTTTSSSRGLPRRVRGTVFDHRSPTRRWLPGGPGTCSRTAGTREPDAAGQRAGREPPGLGPVRGGLPGTAAGQAGRTGGRWRARPGLFTEALTHTSSTGRRLNAAPSASDVKAGRVRLCNARRHARANEAPVTTDSHVIRTLAAKRLGRARCFLLPTDDICPAIRRLVEDEAPSTAETRSDRRRVAPRRARQPPRLRARTTR